MEHMFLRFYNQTDENIDKCIDELKKNEKGIVKVAKKQLKLSCNPIVPEGRNTEVWIYFNTKKELTNFYNNEKSVEIYKKYCMGDNLKEFPHEVEKRNPKDMAFEVA